MLHLVMPPFDSDKPWTPSRSTIESSMQWNEEKSEGS
jgi:hypothetical protein